MLDSTMLAEATNEKGLRMTEKAPTTRKPETLVTRADLEDLVEHIGDLAPYRSFMEKRWIGMVMWWDQRSRDARWKYFTLRAVVVLGGVAIPVLSTLSLLTDWHTSMAVATAVVGAFVAAAAAWDGIANYGETWREKRRAAELLKVEGWQFIQLCGKYEPENITLGPARNYEIAYARFAAEVEQMVAKEVGVYLALFDPSMEQIKRQAAAVAEATVQDALKRLNLGQGQQ